MFHWILERMTTEPTELASSTHQNESTHYGLESPPGLPPLFFCLDYDTCNQHVVSTVTVVKPRNIDFPDFASRRLFPPCCVIVGSQTYRVAHSLQEGTTTVPDGGRVFENESLQKRCKKGLFARISWRSGTALRTDRRTGTSTGIGTSSMCEIAKIGVRFDRRSESLVGTCGDRHE